MMRIAHTTDFSPQSAIAFRHALRLSLAARGRLDLLHVRDLASDPSWDSFPHVREVLHQWGLIDAQASPSDIDATVGVRVSKTEINHLDAAAGISEFLLTHRPDLLVVATHGRHGVSRWLHGSVSEDVARRTHVPTLLIGPGSRSFVDAQSGQTSLRRILVPLTPEPSPTRTLQLLASLLSVTGVTADAFELMHIAEEAADSFDEAPVSEKIERFDGPVVETILRVADERQVDLIAMPTIGDRDLLDTLRGSTTSRVISRAPCPVLTLPLISSGQ